MNTQEIKTVSLIGLGSIGSFFAPGLARTLGEGNFRVIAGGARAERLEREGVRINHETWHFPIVRPEETVAPADLILISVKDTTLDEAIRDIRHHVGEHTIILSLLNGIDSEEKIGAAFGMEHMLYALMRVSVGVRPEGYIYDPRKGHIEFGEKNNTTYSPRVQAVASLFDRAQIPYKIPEDMLHALWFKYLCNIGENLTCALLGIPFGAFRVSDDANFIRHAAMQEVADVAAAYGIHFTEEELAHQEVIVTHIPPRNKPSTLQDIENRRPTEIAMFSGTLIRLGEKAGVPTPYNRMFYHGIRVLEQKNSGEFLFEQ